MENRTDRELLELIAVQVGNLTIDVSGLKSDVSGLKEGQKRLESEVVGMKGEIVEIKSEIEDIKVTVARIEDDHGRKLQTLFDGQTQNTQTLARIEAEVAKHDEFIMKRIK